MKKYIMRWDYGYGDNFHVVEAENDEDASQVAYELWKEDAESNAEYEAIGYTKELAENFGIE